MTALNALPTADITALYNSLADKPVKKFSSKGQAVERLESLLDVQGKIWNGVEIVDKPTRKGDRSTMVIRVLNPVFPSPKKRTGRNPYAVYADGLTVADALAQGVLKRDLWWDVKQGYIELVSAN